jgi:peptidoglycan/xylan/chitin deacetylase (PgdA/CDA1 family)
MFYLVKTPGWVKKVYPGMTWDLAAGKNEVFLTFDDGPHPEQTPFVLDQLAKHNAKATFFCIGKNVTEYPLIYRRILEEGHSVGNHTHNHLNGWKVKDEIYLDNIHKAQQYIDSNLFRPPYGKITRFQARQLLMPKYRLKTVMWTVLSGDFDVSITPEQCLQNVLLHTKAGSIIVFHDSEKAKEKMQYALPGVLKYFGEKGFSFKAIPNS